MPRLGVREHALERQREARRALRIARRPTWSRASSRARPLRRAAPATRSRRRRGSTIATSALDGSRSERRCSSVGEPRQPRLHAVEGLSLGQALPLLRPHGSARSSSAARARTSSVGSSSRTGKNHASARSPWRALVGDRELRQPVDLVAPEVDADGMVGRRRDRRRRSSRAPRARRAPRPGTRAGSPSRRAARRARRGRAASPGRTTIGSTSSTCGPSRCTSARIGATTTAGRCSGRRARAAAATSRAGAGPSSRSRATPARTATSPTPGTARPRRHRGTRRRSPASRSASDAGRHREHDRPARGRGRERRGEDRARRFGHGHRVPQPGARGDDRRIVARAAS